MDKIQLDIIGLQSSQSQSGSFALVLGEHKGDRRLPIIIGMFEAQAIAIEMEKIIPNRPMTHDLFKSFAHEFKYSVDEIIISDLKEGVFFAKIICTGENGQVEVDARPSDAIAISLRFDTKIYTYEKILAEAGIVLSEEEELEDITSSSEEEHLPAGKAGKPAGKPKKGGLKDHSLEKLNEMLEKAIAEEDYERAASIRDEISRRN
ncbi:MAG: bifunctional nuclease family protein [Bacteroidota bacterium]